MALPVSQDVGAELMLGTDSLELIRCRLIRRIEDDRTLDWHQKGRIRDELDDLIEKERRRRERAEFRQQEAEALQQTQMIALRKAELYQDCANIVSKIRLLRAQTEQTIATFKCEQLMRKVEIIDQILRINARYKPVKKKDEDMTELLNAKRQQKLSEAKEQAILDSISRKSMNRAAFIKMVNEKFPDMADDMLDHYDQQLFQQGARRQI